MDKELVAKRIRYWQKRLYLHRWDLYFRFIRGGKAEVEYVVKYYQATVKVGRSISPETLDEFICHELLHCLLSEFGVEVEREEQLIETLTASLMKGVK